MVITPSRRPLKQPFAFSAFLLFLVWSCGILLGVLYARSSKQAFIDIFCNSFSVRLTLVGFLSPTVLPFLISAFAVYFSKPKLLYFLCGLKAFSYAYCNSGISIAIGVGSWLFRLLYMFADLLGLPLLFCFWKQHIAGAKATLSEVIWILTILLFLSGVDYFYITPYVVNHLIS